MLGCGVVCAAGRSVHAQPGASRLALLRELVETIGAAGDALKKVTAGFKELVVTGVQGYDGVQARLLHQKLVDISKDTADLLVAQSSLPPTLGHYAGRAETMRPEQRASAWRNIVNQLRNILVVVDGLLNRVKQDRSDFVLEPAYLKLQQALAARSALLSQLIAIEAPASTEELAIIAEAGQRYAVLIRELESARDEMNAYVKTLKP